MNSRRVFIVIVLAFTVVGCGKREADDVRGSWTQEVWKRGDKIYAGILRQPFLQEMAAGTLEEEKFARYIAQDEVYIGLYVLSIAKLEGNPYREWIEEYGNEDVTREVDVMLQTIDGWMDEVDADTRSAMTRSFLEALLFEYAFWDYGYNGDTKDYSYVYRFEEWL